MLNSYKLSFAQKSIPFNQKINLYRTDDPSRLYALHNETLDCYQYRNNNWVQTFSVKNFPLRQLYFAGKFSNGKAILMGKTTLGVDFYEVKNNEIIILAKSNDFEENQFDDIYGWTIPGSSIKFGRLFTDRNVVGVLTNHPQYGAELYGLMEDELWNDRLPFWPLDTNLSVLGNTSEAVLALSDLKGNGQENIIVHNSAGLNIYRINEHLNVETIMKVPNTQRNDNGDEWLFFPNLSGQPIRDIVLLNSSGLFVYQYDDRHSNYRPIDYQSSFGQRSGWKVQHSHSVQFVDIDADGRDEMFFTGPEGIHSLSFDSQTKRLQSTLDNAPLTVAERHGYVVKALPFPDGPMLFVKYKNQLRWADVSRIQTIEMDTGMDTSMDTGMDKNSEDITYEEPETETDVEIEPLLVDKSLAPPTHQPMENEKNILLLREQFDSSFTRQMVDDHTGKLRFKLPLVALSNTDLEVELFYDDSSQVSGILGIGWSIPQSYIIADFQESIFPEDENYYLIVQDLPQPLTFDAESSSDYVLSFKIASADETDVTIVYYKIDERWEIISKNMKQIYGRRGVGNKQKPAICWGVKWNNWRGSGSSSTGLETFAYAWYLVSVEVDKHILNFDYYTTKANTSHGMHFTGEIYLTKMNDNHGNEITLNYSEKDTSEYDAPPAKNADGNFNMQSVQTKYLTGYHVITTTFEQTIEFRYTVQNGQRFLTEIVQMNDIINEPVLRFTYTQSSTLCMLKRVDLLTEVTVELDYELSGKDESFGEKRFRVEDRHRVDYGDNFVLISYLDGGGSLVLRMFNQEMTSELYSSLSYDDAKKLPRLPQFGGHAIKSYEITLMNDAIVIYAHYMTDDQELFLLHRDEDKWSKTSTNYYYSKQSMIKLGRDFIVAAEYGSSIKIISWNKDTKRWNELTAFGGTILNDDLLLQINTERKIIVISDNRGVSVGYKNRANQWQFKVVTKMVGVSDDINRVWKKFPLEGEYRVQLKDFLKMMALQAHNNLFIVKRLKVDGLRISSLIDLFVLNDAYEVAQHEQRQVFQEDLGQYSNELKTEKGDVFTIKYREKDHQIKAYATDVRGPTMDEINKHLRGSERTETRQKYLDTATNYIEKNQFPHFMNYMAVLNGPSVFCNKKKFTFSGNDWKETAAFKERSKQDVRRPIANKFVLRQNKENDTIRLYEQADNKNEPTKLGAFVMDLNVNNFDHIQTLYPYYMVYQQPNHRVNVIEFARDGKTERMYTLPWVEELSPFSTHNNLVTRYNNTELGTSKTLVFRTLNSIGPVSPNPVIKRSKTIFNEGNHRITRINGREYSDVRVIGNTRFYEKVSIIPNNEKETFGWIEDIKEISNPLNGEKRVFNSKGKWIKTIKSNRKQKDNTMDDLKDMHTSAALFDKTKRLEVAQFLPYEMDDDEVGFYGFEDYEVNGSDANDGTSEIKWIFEAGDVVRNEFSLTGRNYLRLSGNSLIGNFRPTNQNQEYVASCWIRPQNEVFALGDLISNFKVIISDDHRNATFPMVVGEAMLQVGDWFYFEGIVDFLSTKLIQKDDHTPFTLTQLVDGGLMATILLSSSANSTIDVDHVRFSPLNNRFEANVYDSKTNQLKEVISANGLIERNVYDKYQNRIANFDAYGDMKEFTTDTKASSIGRMIQPKCIITIQPDGGFYEDFAPYSFAKRWKLQSRNDWRISRGQLQHLTNDSHDLLLHLNNINRLSYGMRVYYTLQSNGATIQWHNGLKMSRTNDTAGEIIFADHSKRIPLDGEILLVVENQRTIIWIDGGLYFDALSDESLFYPTFTGRIKISDVIVFSNPSVQVTYVNALDEKLQEISMESSNSAIVTAYLYDEIGRQTITTKPVRVTRSQSQSLLNYHPNFVDNRNPHSSDSVFKIGELRGEANDLMGKYAFSQIKYCDHPLNDKCSVGLPGKEFSISGRYATHYSYATNNLFINNLFPMGEHYSYQIEHRPGHVDDISVLNSDGKRVAWYISVDKQKDLLSTYEYDERGSLILTLPPLYHEKVGTFFKLNFPSNSSSNFPSNALYISPSHSQSNFLSNSPLHSQSNSPTNSPSNLPLNSSSNSNASETENVLRDALGVRLQYDEKGNLISKTTPDGGRREFIYDEFGLLTFELHYSISNHDHIETVTYFEYDRHGRLKNTGQVMAPISKESLLTSSLADSDKTVYQEFQNDRYDSQPILRGKTTRTITYNHGTPLIEESMINIDDEVTNKRIIIPQQDKDVPMVIEVGKAFSGGELRMIEYPIDVDGEPFRVTYQYDKFGKVSNVGTVGSEISFASYTYNAAGLIKTEVHSPGSHNSFNRQYHYNSAGFLTRLQDKFLTESVYYTEGGYGGDGRGDGIIVRTKFDATWHEHSDESQLGLNEQSFVGEDITPELSTRCFNELKMTGYINDSNRLARAYYPEFETKLPIVCNYGVTGRQIQRILGRDGFPERYGHSYDYGRYQELTKAKHLVGDEEPMPLQPDSFAKEIAGLNVTASQDIWNKLKNAKFLIQANDKANFDLAHGKRGKSFVRHALELDLRTLQNNYQRFKLPLEKILIETIARKQKLSTLKSSLRNIFMRWSAGESSDNVQMAANKIIEMLERKNYFKNPLANELLDVLKQYEPFVNDIVRVLSQHFGQSLGETEFDVESYAIDANGNHKHFYAGFDRYEMKYRDNTNQIDNINIRSSAVKGDAKNYTMKHDSRGNVIQAMHKGIVHIEYHPVSNRATKIQLTDGRTLAFSYDANGERIMKRVSNKVGKTIKQTHYIRDELGRTLVEREVNYVIGAPQPDILITAYVYGPKGLLGFVRHNKFYSIVTDHEGSTRLVIKDGEVVAAYDYLPYGNLMREYHSSSLGRISYRYTGQEWDEEIGLYNYRARFYDPSIGRFYQIDPKEQYFSPYKYAGNSPISLIDPDGEFAFLLIATIICTIAGAYLGAAAANKTLDPTKWDWKSADTYLGALGGAVTGAFMPIGFVASVGVIGIGATITLGVGGMYASMAAANGEFDPSEWKLSIAETLYAGFQGFGMGSGFAGGVKNTIGVYGQLSSVWSKALFIVGGTGVGVGMFVKNGFDNDWDFTKPGIYFGTVMAVDDAMNFPVFAKSIIKTVNRSGKQIVYGIHGGLNGYKMLGNGGKLISGYRYAATSAGILSVKGMSLLAAGIALTHQDGLDWSDANTYLGIVRNMAQTHQYYSMGKKYLNAKHKKQSLNEGESKSEVLCRRRRSGQKSCKVPKPKMSSGEVKSNPGQARYPEDNQVGSSRQHMGQVGSSQQHMGEVGSSRQHMKQAAEAGPARFDSDTDAELTYPTPIKNKRSRS